MEAIQLLLSDNRGIYIPQHFVQEFDLDKFSGIDSDDIETCRAGPEHEWYWEAWDSILDNATITIDGFEFRLYQDGDLWAICYEQMSAEDKENFGFED